MAVFLHFKEEMMPPVFHMVENCSERRRKGRFFPDTPSPC